MSDPWLSVVGIGADGWNGLSPVARQAIETAELLAGGARHLAMIPNSAAERLAWPSPIGDGIDRLAARRGRPVCVLASGDPMWFGIGATLARRFPSEEMRVIPHPGAFSLAAARLGWPLHDAKCLSAHGRPLAALVPHLHPGAKLLILAENGGTARQLAGLLRAQGYGASRIAALANLGAEGETIRSASAASWDDEPAADLVTLAVEVLADPGVAVFGRSALPDDAFRHDGQLTKREVRAATISALVPWPGALLWDIGAGCGSISIEWMRAGGGAIAIEPHAGRRDMIAHNALALGTPGLAIVAGLAPDALSALPPKPDAVFIGGGLAIQGVIEAAWQALVPGGRLVAHAVSAELEAVLLAWHAAKGGEMTRIAISRLAAVAGHHVWRPLHPVTQYRIIKS